MAHGGNLQQEWVDSSIDFLADDVGRTSGVAIQQPGTTPGKNLSSLQVFDDLLCDLLTDLGLSSHRSFSFAEGGGTTAWLVSDRSTDLGSLEEKSQNGGCAAERRNQRSRLPLLNRRY